MRKVDVNYIRLWRYRSHHVEVPERWEDLKPWQFEQCARMHLGPVDEDDFIYQFFRLPKHLVKQLTKFEKYRLTEMVGFAVNPTGLTDSFYLTELQGTGLLAPTRRLGNMSLEHFALMDTYFFKYVNEPSPEGLSEFVAALYLKRDEQLTSIDFTKRAAYVADKIDKSTQYAVFLNYLFVRRWLSRSFKFLFDDGSQGEDETPQRRRFETPKKAAKTLPRWVDIIDGFVGEDILEYDRYTAMNCVRAFKTINNRIKNYKRHAT